MILLDTNVIVDALDKSQANHQWAKKQIEDAVAAEGGGISVVTLAELCAGARNPADVEPEIKRLGTSWCMTFRPRPQPPAERLTAATSWRGAISGGGQSLKMPLPDFFISAQAEVMGRAIATRQKGRFEALFPDGRTPYAMTWHGKYQGL